MSHTEENDLTIAQPQTDLRAKKPYHRPEFRFERVFETRALSCGKISTTQSQCSFNTKSS
jgi:hypothetical protein